MQFRWSDRQEIIEKVFAKVNGEKLPPYWRELDIEDIKKQIIEEQERIAQKKRGELPDYSEDKREIEENIHNS